ncbi:GHMP_kinases_N domain-containing protein [Cephalotus follicularis]|uniref:glucuronokinase n=1 Tax=Cephalotus follicularis TaxID=3775 RepID=A0A1Q3CEN9_CEPFO|nr:GHMP_kinases_N domain-containing protein [Cephalotus follicularis]
MGGLTLEIEERMASPESMIIEHKAYARIGLVGNPSDVYYGRTISLCLANFWASVKLEPSDHLFINPNPFHDLLHFHSLHHLVNRLQNEGYYGGVRLLMAICKVFHTHCKDNNILLHNRNFTLSYDTNIPRQTGLSGSSAIVCAAMNCLLDFYNVRHLIKVDIRPTLVLTAEKELGIVAGLQDRVAQVYGGLVYMDFSKEHMDKLGHGIYTPMDISLLPPLHLIYAENPSDSGKVHSTVRQRWLNGDELIISSMKEVANLAEEGRNAILEKNYSKLANIMNLNFDLRRRMFGDDCLGALNIEMVNVARRVGAASKFTGSGGAVVVFCPDGPPQVKLLEDACKKAGFIIQPVQVVAPCLNEIDLKTLSN